MVEFLCAPMMTVAKSFVTEEEDILQAIWRLGPMNYHKALELITKYGIKEYNRGYNAGWDEGYVEYQ